MSHAGRPHQDREMSGVGRDGLPGGAVQLHIMWSWCDGLQSPAADCSLSCNESGPGGVDSCSQCGPKLALIAGQARFDCRPLHLWTTPNRATAPTVGAAVDGSPRGPTRG